MSNDSNHRPVVFLAFANDRQEGTRYLRNLPDEVRQLRDVLASAERSGLCEVVVRTNATADDVFQVFQDPKYRNRVAIFHFGGHANSYQLLLESSQGQVAAADSAGLSHFIGQQQGLQLVFLNGCSTEQHAQRLHDANVPVVIVTSQTIDDQVAVMFSRSFYRGLAGGATLETAYHEAVGTVQTEKSGNYRGLYFVPEAGSQLPDPSRFPWELSVLPGAETASRWNLPEAAGDLLYGLPDLPPLDLPESPFRHLSWFDREHAEVFFGRSKEIRELYHLITASDAAPVLMLYGQSGVGKSSLLAAGLLPRLEGTHQLRYLRRDGQKGLLPTLLESLFDGQPPADGAAALRDRWREIEANGKPLTVVLDQVEEAYSRPIDGDVEELAVFVEAVQRLFADRANRPAGRLILSFRKEWVAEIDRLLAEAKIPRGRFFLQRLDRDGAIDAILGPARSTRFQQQYGLQIEEDLAETIADELSQDRDSALAPTLQILLTKMWHTARDRDLEHPHFDRELYDKMRRDGVLLGDFLDQQIKQVEAWRGDVVNSGLLLDLLGYHTTALGTSQHRSVEEIAQDYQHNQPLMPSLLQKCKDLYLLVDPAANKKDSEQGTRLSHDTLAPLVRQRFEASDLPGQRARRILQSRGMDWQDGQQGDPLDETDLATVEQGIEGTRSLDDDEQRLLQTSRARRDANRRRRRMVQTVLAISAVAIVGLWVRAYLQRKAAEANFVRAQENFELAREAGRDFFQTVSDDVFLKNDPRFMPLRDYLLQRNETFQNILISRSEGDSSLTIDIANAYYDLGIIRREMSNEDRSSLAYFEEAQRRLDELPEAERQSDAFKTVWADVQIQLGNWWQDHKSWEKAVDSYSKARKTREELKNEDPKDLERIRKLASVLMNLGNTHHKWSETLNQQGAAEKNTEAEKELKEAQAVRANALKNLPNDEQDTHLLIRRDLGRGFYNLAMFYDDLALLYEDIEAPKKAVACARKAGDCARNAVQAFVDCREQAKANRQNLDIPRPNEYRLEIAKSRHFLSRLLENTDSTEANAAFEQARVEIDSLCKDTSIPSFKYERAQICYGYPECLGFRDKISQVDQAIDDLVELINMEEERKRQAVDKSGDEPDSKDLRKYKEFWNNVQYERALIIYEHADAINVDQPDGLRGILMDALENLGKTNASGWDTQEKEQDASALREQIQSLLAELTGK